jgi:hypothetical protein
MVDTVQLMTDRLSSTDPSNPVTIALAGGVIAAEELPEKFDPTAGKCAVVVASRGGNSHSEILDLVQDRLQVTIWAGRNGQLAAKILYRAVHDWLHGAQNIDGMKVCLEVVNGQAVTDPDTGWASVIAFYQVTAIGSGDVFIDGGAFS